MLKNSKRKIFILISFIIISIILVSIFFILQRIYNHKELVNIGLVQKNLKIINPEKIICLKLKNLEYAPKIINNKYKDYNWRIIIPKINVNAPILEGTNAEVLRKGVGHFENTSKTERQYMFSCS